MSKFYKVNINEDFSLELPLVETKEVDYYSFNMMGMTKWNKIAGLRLFELIKLKYQDMFFDTIVTVESKAIGLVQVLSELLGIDRYVIMRKEKKSYMKDPKVFKSKTFISGECSYWIDGIDLEFLKQKQILVVDDVISTGGTISAIMNALYSIDIKPKLIACVLTEKIKWTQYDLIDVLSIDHIPVLERDQKND